MSSGAALPLLRNGCWPSSGAPSEAWNATQATDRERLKRDVAAALAGRLRRGGEPGDGAAAYDRLERAVDAEARRRLDRFLTGIEMYRNHPHRRDLPRPPEIWREGGSAALDHKPDAPERDAPILFVPSLVNRAYILDLDRDVSLVRWLAGDGCDAPDGLRPILLDWGKPEGEECGFGFADYVVGRLSSALDATIARTGRRPILVGYCMGGLLAAALACRRPRDIAALVLLATPWDFHAERERHARLAGGWARAASAWGDHDPDGAPDSDSWLASRPLPVDLLQAMFAAVDPLSTPLKFARFAGMDQDSEAARLFVALEDWLNDGVPLAGPVGQEVLVGWYGENTPGRGAWSVAGTAVTPERLAQTGLPILVVLPTGDRIVPPASAGALADRLPGCARIAPNAGHIGMVTGRRARTALWRPLAQWCLERS